MTRKGIGFLALAFILAAGVATAGALYAQQSGRMGGMMGMMKMMEDCPMMSGMRESPQAVLRQREALGLSADQIGRLEALQERTVQAREPMMEDMHSVHQQIRSATEGERFDEAAARAAFGRMGDLHTEMAVAMLRTRGEVRDLLTPEQRTELREMGGGMMGMGGGMNMMEMMQDCPMMQGGMMHDGMMHEGMMHEGMRMQGSKGGSMQSHPGG